MFQRIANLFRAFLNMFVSGLEKRSPEALIELEKENLRKQITKFNEGLAAHAGLSEKLISQVKRLEAEERDLTAKITANVKAGNRDVAAQYAVRLQTIKQQLAESREQMEEADSTYQNLVAARDQAIHAAKLKIDQVKASINDTKVQKAMAEMHEMASGMISSIGGSGDTLDRLHGMVQEERDKAAGRARVAKDSMSTDGVQMKVSEQKALADQALDDFLAQQGLNSQLDNVVQETVNNAQKKAD